MHNQKNPARRIKYRSRETQQNSNADTDSTGSVESNAEVQDMAEESIQLSIDDIRRELKIPLPR